MSALSTALVVLGVLAAAVLWVGIGVHWLGQRPQNLGALVRAITWSLVGLTAVSAILHRLTVNEITSAFVGIESALAIGVAGLFATIFLVVIIGARWPRNDPRLWVVVFGLGYFAVQLVALAINEQFSDGILQIAALMVLPGLLVLVFASGMTKTEMLRLAYHVSATVTVLSVALGFVLPDLAFGHDYGDVRRFPVLGFEWRMSGITPHQNLLSFTAILAILTGFALRARSRWVSALTAVAAIGLGESRNAAISIVVIGLLWWVLAGRTRLGRVILAVPVLAAVAVAAAPTLVEEINESGLASDAATFTTRTAIWDLVGASFPAAPIFGWGPLAFQDSAATPFPPLNFLNAHNQWLQAVAEGGVLGLITMTGMILALVVISLRHHREPVYLSTMVAVVMSMITEVFFTIHQYGVSYTAVPALLVLLIMMSADAPSAEACPSVGSAAEDVLPARPVADHSPRPAR